MKNLYLLIFIGICLLVTSPVKAQLQDQRNNLSIGVNIRYIGEKYFKMICGIQGEVNFSQRGWKEVIEDGTGDTYHRTMNYIEIPLLAHLAFGKDKGNGVRFVLNLGPQVGYLIGENETMSETWDPSGRTPNAQYGKMADKKFDYGIVGGGGMEVQHAITSD